LALAWGGGGGGFFKSSARFWMKRDSGMNSMASSTRVGDFEREFDSMNSFRKELKLIMGFVE